MVVEVFASLEDYKTVINGDTPVLIDFWATWCGPCRAISPFFEKLSNLEASKNVKFYKVDVDQQSDISEAVGIRVMPTFLLFKNGEKAGQALGAAPAKLEDLLVTAKSLVESAPVPEPEIDTSSSVADDLESSRVA